MKLMPETVQRCRNRERCAKPCKEKGDDRRQPQSKPVQLELPLEYPDERE